MAATRQSLADAGQIRALIDNALTLMLQLEEEEQLLNGNGSSPNLLGLLDAAVPILKLDANTLTSLGHPNIDAIRHAIRKVRTGAARATVDFVGLHPNDSATYDTLTDQVGQYYSGNPFSGQAGDGSSPIWRKRRVESEAIPEGYALVGAGQMGATVLERQGITIITADQHADFFIRNLVVVLAEERLGFPIWFPEAFCLVALTDWEVGS
jgi:HK97 family phage major capsid protein